jgi:hypothetical protein
LIPELPPSETQVLLPTDITTPTTIPTSSPETLPTETLTPIPTSPEMASQEGESA